MRYKLRVPNAVQGWNSEQRRRTRSLPSWRARSAASHSLGLGIKETVHPEESHPGSWTGLRTWSPFFGKSGVSSSWLPWCWWVVGDFPKPPSSGPSGSPVNGQWCQPLRTTRDGRACHPPLPQPGPASSYKGHLQSHLLWPLFTDDQAAGVCRILLHLVLVVTMQLSLPPPLPAVWTQR